jgi:CubicO group peptidase (beta-lactamase class C family)
MRKKIGYILISSVAVIITITTASFIFHRPVPKAAELRRDTKRLNLTVTNADSEYPELKGLDKKMQYYMRKWQFKGISLAITRGDSLVYAKGYGWAEEEKGIEMEPGHIMRMASVSKLLTAAGIMVLQDKGLLNIKDTVFGPSGILNDTLFNSVIKDKNHHKITVEHLLRHQGGFHRDPVFSSRDVKYQMQLDHAPTKEDFYKLVLSRRLRFAPGTWQKYSNFGYMLLSDIIEKVSGMPYEEFMKKEVFAPAGCYDFHIAGNYYEDKRKNEVRYYTHEGDGKFIEEYNDSGNIVERCYGGNNIPLLSGAGAWCGSPIEIARFVAAIDGDPGVPDIITAESVALMTEYFDTEKFSLGWNDTNPNSGWSRSGTLSGTCALVKRFPDGECWVLITNTSTWKGPRQAKLTNELFRQCRTTYGSRLPKVNLFE